MSIATWGHGYVTEVEYPANYYRELNPAHLNFCAQIKQVYAPNPALAFNYLELGCGNGLTLNALALNYPDSQFWGVDFNPAHIVDAHTQAHENELSNVQYFDWSFSETLEQALPAMDFIVLHGIYSWVNQENRSYVERLLQRLLRPGGLVYVSYNCLPGWTQEAPVRRLLTELAQRVGGTVVEKLTNAKKLLTTALDLPLNFTQLNPHSRQVIETLTTQDPHYLVHEYLNSSWELFYFADVAKRMQELKLNYIASATVMENISALCATSETQQFIDAQSDPVIRETLLDFSSNKRFRRDIYLRGARARPALEHNRDCADMVICLARARNKCDLNVLVPVGAVELPAAVYQPLLDELAKGPKRLGELTHHLRAPISSVLNAAAVLLGLGYASLYFAELDEIVRLKALRFNQRALAHTCRGQFQPVLMAPNLKSAVRVEEFEQYFIQAHSEKVLDTAAYVWEIMKTLRRFFSENNQVITDEAKSLAMLRDKAKNFEENYLPLFSMWGVLAN